MIRILEILILLSIFIFSYNLLSLKNKRYKKVVKETKGEDYETKTDLNNYKKIKEILNLNSISKTIEKRGNPFKLSAAGYLSVKFIMSILMFISMFSRFNNLIIGLMSGAVGFFFIDYIYIRSNRNDLAEIRLDLGDVYNLIRLKISAGNQLGIALVQAHSVAKHKRFKKALFEMAAKINMTGKTVEALDEFKDKFNFSEIDMFVNSIKQSLETGLAEKIMDGQAKQIERKNISYMRKKTNRIDVQLLLIVLLIFFGVVATVFLAVGSETSRGVIQIFK